jgi:Glycosyl transferase family 11
VIIFSNKCGQLGNRLFCFGHLIAYATAHNLTVLNLSFDEYSAYFETTKDDVLCRYPAKKSWIKSTSIRSYLFVMIKATLKVLRAMRLNKSALHQVWVADIPEYRFSDNRFFDLASSELATPLNRGKAHFLYGRFFRDYANFKKNENVIRAYFTPELSLAQSVNSFVERMRMGEEKIVGVHIRRGDYNQFVEGRYFYTLKQYAQKMTELQASSAVKLKFILSSNEPVTGEIFAGLNFQVAPGHRVADMYLLAHCDYIMGPPSTYSMWAAFYGNKPIYQIRNMDLPVTLNVFKHLPPEELYNFSFN